MRTPLAALAVLFLAVQLLYLPRTLEDVDSVNFALGVRQFDVTEHQPHPPGYPVFIALARLSTGIVRALGLEAPAVRGLAMWSVISGAALIPLLFALFAAASRSNRFAWWATAVTVCSPLFWFSALRPLSDMTGLACAVGVQALLLPLLLGRGNPAGAAIDPLPAAPGVLGPGGRLLAGAALSGLAAGVRSQTVFLTAPLLLATLVAPVPGVMWHTRGAAVLFAIAGALAWAIPLLVVTGGPAAYLEALGTQAGEDFAGVEMLWTTPRPRVAAEALLNTFVWPWGSLPLGFTVVVLAAAGAAVAAWRAPRLLAVLALAFGPYAIFHLLFQETITMRYALPLVPPVAFLALIAAAGAGRLGLVAAGALLVLIGLGQTLPAARAYAVDGSPAFRLVQRVLLPAEPEAIGLHGVMRRVEEWEHQRHGAAVLRAPHGREWLALVQHWRTSPDGRVLFLADPRRTDLALFDPNARRLAASARWTLPEAPFVAGTRPGPADLYAMEPPGWMLDRGWALTAEVGGVTSRDGLGPSVQPSVAWVRARPGAATLIVGGRNLAAEGGASARLSIATDAGAVDVWEAPPGFFFRHVSLPAGSLAGSGSGYLALRVGAVGEPEAPPVSLEQFDLQSGTTAMFGFLQGWQEPEYNPRLGLAWRWMSESARLWVKPVGRDVTLTLAGESPLRYFDAAPAVRMRVAGSEVAAFGPSADFTQEVILPAALLAASDGVVVIESDRWFSPAERSGGADQRHLALRIYGVSVR